MMILYKIALVVVLSTPISPQETVIIPMDSWEACVSSRDDLTQPSKSNPQNVTADCRRNVRLDIGSR